GATLHAMRPPPDVLVVSEIENKALLERLFHDYAVDLPLEYRAWVGGAESATGVAIASRYPIVAVRSLLARSGDEPALRPILEARLRLPESELIVFANHWKSKRGGAAATEPLRRAAARLLSSRLREIAEREADLPVIVAGDLNEQPRENEYIDAAYPTALMDVTAMRQWEAAAVSSGPHGQVPSWFSRGYRMNRHYLPITREIETLAQVPTYYGIPVFASLWSAGDDPGSYWYFGRWERIDHVLVNAAGITGPALTFREFQTVQPTDGVDAEGAPLSWQEGGISDHLPIMAVFDRRAP
ncbi:MAG TPA: endonuclease/exonuclease/phosphatase family protein, partial [Alkalispirochaeta sp.]|nr:endonuclease/exonuclease/phosphatase family protein [Alkalispirochaeta sp.]